MTKEEAIKLVNKNSTNFISLSEEMKEDKDIAMIAVKSDGALLRYVSDELKDNYDLVLLAVSKNVLSLQEASEAMRANADIVKAAVKNDSRAISYAHPDFKNNKELAILVLSKNVNHVRFFSDEIQQICGNEDQVNRLLKAIASENLSNSLSASLDEKFESPNKKI